MTTNQCPQCGYCPTCGRSNTAWGAGWSPVTFTTTHNGTGPITSGYAQSVFKPENLQAGDKGTSTPPLYHSGHSVGG
jgi:hypothetical protein